VRQLKILFDEDSSGFTKYFHGLDWDVKTVHDLNLAGKDDEVVAEYAKANDYILITKDKKLAKVATFHDIKYLHLDEPLIAKMLVKKLSEEYSST